MKEVKESLSLSRVKVGRRRMERVRETEAGTRGISLELSLSLAVGRLANCGKQRRHRIPSLCPWGDWGMGGEVC